MPTRDPIESINARPVPTRPHAPNPCRLPTVPPLRHAVTNPALPRRPSHAPCRRPLAPRPSSPACPSPPRADSDPRRALIPNFTSHPIPPFLPPPQPDNPESLSLSLPSRLPRPNAPTPLAPTPPTAPSPASPDHPSASVRAPPRPRCPFFAPSHSPRRPSPPTPDPDPRHACARPTPVRHGPLRPYQNPPCAIHPPIHSSFLFLRPRESTNSYIHTFIHSYIHTSLIRPPLFIPLPPAPARTRSSSCLLAPILRPTQPRQNPQVRNLRLSPPSPKSAPESIPVPPLAHANAAARPNRPS